MTGSHLIHSPKCPLTMKKLAVLLVTFCMLGLAPSSRAQKMNLNVYGNYVFDDSYESYYDNYNYYNGKIKGGFQWGAGLEFFVKPMYSIELLYLRQDTKAPTYYRSASISGQENYINFDMGINYIMLAGGRHMPSTNGKIDGYGGLMLGMAIVDINNPDNGYSDNATKFAWGARLGCNIWVTPKVGIKLQTQLTSVTQGAGGGFYFGTGGAGVGVSTYSSVYQFGLGGGLAFRLGH